MRHIWILISYNIHIYFAQSKPGPLHKSITPIGNAVLTSGIKDVSPHTFHKTKLVLWRTALTVLHKRQV